MICKLKLHSQGWYWKHLRALHALEDLEPLFKFPIHLSVRKSWENYRQIYGKSKASLWRNLSTGTPPNFFRTILCFVALVYNWYFFQNSRFTEIIRHKILVQTLLFLTRLPTRQDGVENRDKVYAATVNTLTKRFFRDEKILSFYARHDRLFLYHHYIKYLRK